jgi:hypothetical protein
MYHIAYLSSAVREFTKPQLRELLELSRKKNLQLGITGLLLYRGGNFLQVIEGEETDVKALYNKVCQDPRHTGIFKMLDEACAEREFPNWTMAFQDLEIEDVNAIPGYSDFLSPSWRSGGSEARASKARKLLAGFKERLR